MKKTYIAIIAGCILLGFLAIFFTREKTGFVDNNRLFSEFNATKELQKNVQDGLLKDKTIIDSLNKNIDQVEKLLKSKSPTVDELMAYKKLVLYNDSLKYVYQQSLQDANAKISTQVWNTLNEYIIEYGKKKGYKYIFGASGNGSLMYASDKKDITEDILQFVNKKYEGK